MLKMCPRRYKTSVGIGCQELKSQAKVLSMMLGPPVMVNSQLASLGMTPHALQIAGCNADWQGSSHANAGTMRWYWSAQ